MNIKAELFQPTVFGRAGQPSQSWRRLEHNQTPIYVQPEGPDWLVPTRRGDRLLQTLLIHPDPAAAAALSPGRPGESASQLFYDLNRLQHSLNSHPPAPYLGRRDELHLDALRECWFHLTDQCNLSCCHCLFSASPAKKRYLPLQDLRAATDQALALGCRIFYFTGGEPLLYPGLFEYLRHLLARNPEVHAVILTNGLLLAELLPKFHDLERLHLQVSLDGLEKSHDLLRGRGSFKALMDNLAVLQQAGCQTTLSVAVSRENIADLPQLMELAAANGALNIHLLYHFIRGKGSAEQFVRPDEIFPKLLAAWQRADELGIVIDNIETIRSQVFASPGTRYDLSNTGWESLAVGPDGVIYPSPALVGLKETACGPLSDGLEQVWRFSSVMNDLRASSLVDSRTTQTNPLKFLIGGGDIDHSFLHGGTWTGHDPYMELYNLIALELISRQTRQYSNHNQGLIRLRMGDVRQDCLNEDSGEQTVALTHCNCVISISHNDGHGQVREFYSQAALTANDEIVNPLAPAQARADFIPTESRKRSYGCGSPVTDAVPRPGETVVDLGSGSGVECFMAADAVGDQGRVIGIDMTDEMLILAREAQGEVAARLGYDIVEFRKGLLEEIPLADNTADAIISNCVINLSPDKRMTYQEIVRVLKPGGRLVVSDIVTDSSIPPRIRNNIRYRDECLGGAMQQEELLLMMESAGLTTIRQLKRFPYRRVEGMDFFSLTYEARKPRTIRDDKQLEVIYRGPHGGIYSEAGTLLLKGCRTTIKAGEIDQLDDSVFILGQQGEVTNLLMKDCCCTPQSLVQPVDSVASQPAADRPSSRPRLKSGCMVCGADVCYFHEPVEMGCSYCGTLSLADACCTSSHFVCDHCHQESGLAVIKSACRTSQERDLLGLLQAIRSHPALPTHGPEHHALIPGIIIASFRNCGGRVDDETLMGAIERGASVPGGVCGFWGTCGAAIGAGIGVAALLEATPLTPGPRQLAQRLSGQILTRVSQYRGGRCCQRESFIALRETARMSEEILGIELPAQKQIHCDQYLHNRECIRKQCPLWAQRQTDLNKEDFSPFKMI